MILRAMLLASVIIVVTIALAVFWPQLEAPPLEWTNQPFPVDSPVHPGDTLRIIYTYCNQSTENIRWLSRRLLRNRGTGERFRFPDTPGSHDKPGGCVTFINRAWELPVDLPPGVYRTEAYVEVQGRWRTFDIFVYSQPFEVLEQKLP